MTSKQRRTQNEADVLAALAKGPQLIVELCQTLPGRWSRVRASEAVEDLVVAGKVGRRIRPNGKAGVQPVEYFLTGN